MPVSAEICVAICTERVEAKVSSAAVSCPVACCNLHGACGGKDDFAATHSRQGDVAICTERVEAKDCCQWMLLTELRVAICTERVEAKVSSAAVSCPVACCNLHGACGGKDDFAATHSRQGDVAICTERVEAKDCCQWMLLTELRVAICTERVEAKPPGRAARGWHPRCNLHGACGGKGLDFVAVECRRGCNLHGACGGKV